MFHYLKKFSLILIIIITIIGGTCGFFYWKKKNNPPSQNIPNQENSEKNENKKVEELKTQILICLDTWQSNSQGDTKNAIKTTVKSLNNSDLNNSQQLATVKELLTNHQEKETISESDSDDGYETADDDSDNGENFKGSSESETKKKELTQNYQKLQSLYQQWVIEANKGGKLEEKTPLGKIKTEIIAGLQEWKETISDEKFREYCDGSAYLLSENVGNVKEKVQLGAFQHLLKENKDDTNHIYRRLKELALDWESELKNNSSWEEEKKDWFKEKRWLTDFEIDWAINQIKEEHSIAPNSDYKFLEAMNFMYAKEAGKENQAGGFMSFPLLLNEITSFKGELIFIPVNNPDFHWSLLVYEQATNVFYHYDTLKNSPNNKYVEPLVNELLIQILQKNEPDLDEHLKFINAVKQDNSYDCGVAVIAIIKRIIEKYDDEYDIDDVALERVDLGEFDFLQERQELREKHLKKDE